MQFVWNCNCYANIFFISWENIPRFSSEKPLGSMCVFSFQWWSSYTSNISVHENDFYQHWTYLIANVKKKQWEQGYKVMYSKL